MAALLAGDTIVDEKHPLRVLWVDRAERVRAPRHVLAFEKAFFEVRECHSLADGIEAGSRDSYDVVVLATDLPDAWPSDVVLRFTRDVQDIPVIVVTEGRSDPAAARQADRHPFCVVDRARADPTSMRRLVISAGILARTLRTTAQGQEVSHF